MHGNSSFALITITLLFLFSTLKAQSDDRVLLRVNDTGITAEEFIRLYSKNREIGDRPDFDEYFNQFLIFRLKVEQAVDEGLDTTLAFRNEFEGYRNQLARDYLIDKEAREGILLKAFERLQYEVNASHILIACPPGANPADSAAAFSKAIELRTRITEGESFSEVARATSDDPSAAVNGGNLGWFTAMQMVSQFEDAVYDMNPGDLSGAVRTPYGYHIIRLNGKRVSSGRIRVAHIMKAMPPGASDQDWIDAGETIKTLLGKIRQGASFEEVASKESDHRESASGGGELGWFGAGEIVSEFSEAAFALTSTGDISGPVRTPYGWHIIKLLERKPLGSFEDNRSALESRLSESYLNTAARRSLVEKLKTEYNFVLNQGLIDEVAKITDSAIVSGGKEFVPGNPVNVKVFFFDGGEMTLPSLKTMIENNIDAFNGMNASAILNQMIENNYAEMLISYEDSRLEFKYPDFRYLVKEFHDGMLLFEINSREVWNKPYTDSTGLLTFYRETMDDYPGEPSITAKIYSIRGKGTINTLEKLVRKYGNSRNGDAKIIGRFSSVNDTSVVINEGKWHRGDDIVLDSYIDKRGTYTHEWRGMPSVIEVTKVHSPEPKPFEEIRNEVAAAYQTHLEEKWMEQLKKRYTVWVNERLLDELKAKLNGKN